MRMNFRSQFRRAAALAVFAGVSLMAQSDHDMMSKDKMSGSMMGKSARMTAEDKAAIFDKMSVQDKAAAFDKLPKKKKMSMMKSAAMMKDSMMNK